MKVLLVEDEKDTANSLRRGLARHGYSIDLAGRGAEALECLAVNAYDLMLLDLNLPDVDGLDVCLEAHHRSNFHYGDFSVSNSHRRTKRQSSKGTSSHSG